MPLIIFGKSRISWNTVLYKEHLCTLWSIVCPSPKHIPFFPGHSPPQIQIDPCIHTTTWAQQNCSVFKKLMFISTQEVSGGLQFGRTAAFKRFSMAWLAFVYIFIRVIFCPMSFNISFKIFALDKIHAVIMCHFFCKIWLKKPERNSFMTKVSANHCALIDSFSGMLWFNFFSSMLLYIDFISSIGEYIRGSCWLG